MSERVSRNRVAILAPYVSYPTFGDARSRKGGVERYVTELARGLARCGFETTLIAPLDGDANAKSSDSVIYIPRMGLFFATPVFNPMHLIRVSRGFDLLHTQGTFPILSELNPVIAGLHRVPSVITYHFEPSPPGTLGEVAGKVYSSTLARMIKRHDRIIFSSESYKMNAGLFEDGAWDDKIRYIPMGVDTDFFVPDQHVAVGDHFLFVGRFVPYKDIPLLFRAMRLVNDALPNHSLLVAGSGPLETEIRELAARLDINVKFLGRIGDEQLRSIYQSSIATVLASHDHQEAFGMVLAESQSCGTPVVAADVPGVADVARVGGTVVKPCSAEALAEAMIAAAGKKRTQADRSELHDKMKARYSWSKIAERTAEVYKELL